MTTNFSIICINCWEHDQVIIDDCHVHIADASIIMLKCMNCGYEEYISEKIKHISDKKKRILQEAHHTISEYLKGRYQKRRKN